MITLVISNDLDNSYGNFVGSDEGGTKMINYDPEVYKDGRVYHFWSLRGVAKFIDDHPIDFTDECKEKFSCWSWDELDLRLDIDIHKRNTLVYYISVHPEWRD